MTEQTAFSLAASAVGLVSAIFFCIGNISNTAEKIKLQSSSFWDFSEPIARALSAQRAQYVTGGLLLLLSFSFQVFSTVASSTELVFLPNLLASWQSFVPAIVLPTGLVSWIVCWSIDCATIKGVLKRHEIQRVADELEAKKQLA